MRIVLHRFLFLVLSMTLVGCDTYHHEQYKISKAANVLDRIKVRAVLASISEASGLHDCTSVSHAPDTLAFYCDMDVPPYSGAQLGAREVGDSVIVDLRHSLGGQTRSFNHASRLLWPVLLGTFGPRVHGVGPTRAEPAN